MMRTFRGLGPSATVWLSLTSATLANTEAELESVAPWGPGITIILVMAAALFCFFIYTKERTDSAKQELFECILMLLSFGALWRRLLRFSKGTRALRKR